MLDCIVKCTPNSNSGTVRRRLTTGIRSEKCVVRRHRRCANVIYVVYVHKPRYYSLLHSEPLGSHPTQGKALDGNGEPALRFAMPLTLRRLNRIYVTFTSYLTEMHGKTCFALQVNRLSFLPTGCNKTDNVNSAGAQSLRPWHSIWK